MKEKSVEKTKKVKEAPAATKGRGRGAPPTNRCGISSRGLTTISSSFTRGGRGNF